MTFAWAQTTKTVYFDQNWNVVRKDQPHTYYRVVNLDNSGTPIGTVKSYYKSGSLQWSGRFLSKNIDCTTCEECECEGKCTWYYENGQKKSESTYSYGKLVGQEKYWDESGKEIDQKVELIKWIASENGFKSVLELNIKKRGVDPLEGIYNATSSYQYFVNKKPVKNISGYAKFGILRSNNEYKVFEIDIGPSEIEILNSTDPNNYRATFTQLGKYGNKIVSRGSVKQIDLNKVKMVFEISQEAIKEAAGASYNSNVDMFLEYNLSKYFPSTYDLERINKEITEEAPRSGTGFAISSDGLIATNFHVIEKAKSIKVRGVNGNFKQSFKAEVVLEDKVNDVAIIKIDESQFTSLGTIPYRIKKSGSDVGEDIFVLGYPLTATMGDEVKLSTGIISSKTGYLSNVSQYQISAPIQPGNSGGPLFDKAGNLVGIVSSKHLDTENVGYAIKVSYLQNIIDILPQKLSSPNNIAVFNKSLSEQVKILRNFVFIIEINND